MRSSEQLLLNKGLVEVLEVKYRITLPSDFRDYLLRIGREDRDIGQDAVEFDDQEVCWWGLDRVQSAKDEYPHGFDLRQV